MDIGEKLRLLRIRRGLTQEDMADRCELSKGFISQVERNLANLFAEVRANFRNIPDRVVSALIGSTDEREVKAVLLREIDLVLHALADSDVLIEPSEDDEEASDDGEV